MSGPRVALTFDAEHPDRPASAGTAEAIVATLDELGVRATFFVQGRWAEAYPELVGAIARTGHLVGHHSHYHTRMPLLTNAGIDEDLRDGAAAIEAAAGIDPKPWFRCPFGAGSDDPRVQGAIVGAGYRHVGWHVAADDWDLSRSATAVEADVVAGARAHGDGAVVLLHTWPAVTGAAIRPIIDRLRDSGAEFCRVDELSVIPAGVPS